LGVPNEPFGFPLKPKGSISIPFATPIMPRIDVHHHFFPPDLHDFKAQANQDLGWKTPPGHLKWSPELSLKAMDELGVSVSILSFPALSTGAVSEENRNAARSRNEFVHRVCKKYPDRFGFFASLPFLDDVEGIVSVTLHERRLICSRMPG